jgi:SAM-dependent methyltransferase
VSESELPEHVSENRAHWDAMAHDWVAAGERNWATEEPSWGCWGIPEAELGLLPADMTGKVSIELGCGTGYVSSWLARHGASIVGIDNSERQLATARRLASEHGVEFTLHHGNAEAVPYPDEHFDFAISEYGAAIWCDPLVWIPEAHRLLKPGGELVFLGNSPLSMLCWTLDGAKMDSTLHRDYFSLHRVDWRDVEVDPGGIEFNMPISHWFRLFKDTGFEVLEYLELQAPEDAEDKYGQSAEWAKRWPSEQVWKLRRL